MKVAIIQRHKVALIETVNKSLNLLYVGLAAQLDLLLLLELNNLCIW